VFRLSVSQRATTECVLLGNVASQQSYDKTHLCGVVETGAEDLSDSDGSQRVGSASDTVLVCVKGSCATPINSPPTSIKSSLGHLQEFTESGQHEQNTGSSLSATHVSVVDTKLCAV
jgi:hypothetical protein